jgi:hypothetical protein
MNKIENKTKNIKLHSSRAIMTATFIGGPLAAGYLISENFKALNKHDEGRKSLMIGIITTIILFLGLILLTEKTFHKIPKQIIPLIYTGIIWAIVEWKQGDDLDLHKKNGNIFFSGWSAIRVGLISLSIIALGIFSYSYIESSNPAYKAYEKEMSQFLKNETETLVFYRHLKTKTDYTLLRELTNKTIPKWKENIKIIKKSNNIKNLPSDLLQQNIELLEYSKLRLEAFELFRKSILENTDRYSQKLEQIHLKIDKQLEKLN